MFQYFGFSAKEDFIVVLYYRILIVAFCVCVCGGGRGPVL